MVDKKNIERPKVDFLSLDGYGNPAICCPECGFSYTEIIDHKLERGNDNGDTGRGCRGDVHTLLVNCECGGVWELFFGFHKGETSVKYKVLKSCHGKSYDDLGRLRNAIDANS